MTLILTLSFLVGVIVIIALALLIPKALTIAIPAVAVIIGVIVTVSSTVTGVRALPDSETGDELTVTEGNLFRPVNIEDVKNEARDMLGDKPFIVDRDGEEVTGDAIAEESALNLATVSLTGFNAEDMSTSAVIRTASDYGSVPMSGVHVSDYDYRIIVWDRGGNKTTCNLDDPDPIDRPQSVFKGDVYRGGFDLTPSCDGDTAVITADGFKKNNDGTLEAINKQEWSNGEVTGLDELSEPESMLRSQAMATGGSTPEGQLFPVGVNGRKALSYVSDGKLRQATVDSNFSADEKNNDNDENRLYGTSNSIACELFVHGPNCADRASRVREARERSTESNTYRNSDAYIAPRDYGESDGIALSDGSIAKYDLIGRMPIVLTVNG